MIVQARMPCKGASASPDRPWASTLTPSLVCRRHRAARMNQSISRKPITRTAIAGRSLSNFKRFIVVAPSPHVTSRRSRDFSGPARGPPPRASPTTESVYRRSSSHPPTSRWYDGANPKGFPLRSGRAGSWLSASTAWLISGWDRRTRSVVGQAFSRRGCFRLANPAWEGEFVRSSSWHPTPSIRCQFCMKLVPSIEAIRLLRSGAGDSELNVPRQSFTQQEAVRRAFLCADQFAGLRERLDRRPDRVQFRPEGLREDCQRRVLRIAGSVDHQNHAFALMEKRRRPPQIRLQSDSRDPVILARSKPPRRGERPVDVDVPRHRVAVVESVPLEDRARRRGRP